MEAARLKLEEQAALEEARRQGEEQGKLIGDFDAVDDEAEAVSAKSYFDIAGGDETGDDDSGDG